MKKLIIFATALVFMLSFASPAISEGTPRVRVDGEFVEIPADDQQPIIVDGRTLVPLRAVMERLGFRIDWEPYPLNRAMLRKSGFEIGVTIGSDTMFVNGDYVSLEVPAQIINNRTMVPLRAISEATGMRVDWDAYNHIVDIFTDENIGSIDLSALEQAVRAVGTHREILQQFPGIATQELQTAFEQEVIRLVNGIRIEHGLEPRIFHPDLARIARLRTDEIIEHNSGSSLGHLSPVDGTAFTSFARARGLDTQNAGENAAWGALSPQMVVDGWMNSPGHRAFILNEDEWNDTRWKYIGVGFSFGDLRPNHTAWTLWQMVEPN